MKMYVILDGKRNGPHEPEDVKALYDSGKVSEDDLAWKAGMDEWKPLNELFPEWIKETEEPSTITSLPSVSESIEPSPAPEESDAKEASFEKEGAPDAESAEQAAEPADEEPTPPDESTKPAPKPAAPPPDKLYLGMAGERRGPLSPDETQALFLSGEVQGNDLAWKDGMDEWKPLNEVWPDCMNVATTSGTDETDPPTDLSARLRNKLRKE